MAERPPRLPPRWFIRTAWYAHRALYRVTRGHRGLWLARPTKWGTIRLTTTGRRSGRPRSVILAYLEDGPNLVTMAMNGWGEGDPAWWLNVCADPAAEVEILDDERHLRTVTVRAREAVGEERDRIWAAYRAIDPHLDGFAAGRSTPTPVVVLEPVPG
jgi:deazaflavin-dependent oxidoreductase (nitroreductase family)